MKVQLPEFMLAGAPTKEIAWRRETTPCPPSAH